MKVYVFFYYVMSSLLIAGLVSDHDDLNGKKVVAAALFGALWPVYLPGLVVRIHDNVIECKAEVTP